MDLKNLKKKFEIDGYVIFKNFFEEDSLNNITKISQEILDRASEGKWRHVRIYRDYPNFFNNLNIFGVDYPLNFDLNKGTFAIIVLFDREAWVSASILCEIEEGPTP